MSSRPRIGIDLDGVIYQWASAALFLLEWKFGLRLDVEDWSSTGWLDEQISAEQMTWLWTEGVERGLFRFGHIYRGAAEGLRALSDLGDLVVITHRPNAWTVKVAPEHRRTITRDTLDWLAFLHLPITEVHMLMEAQPKSSVPCDFYIDDGPHVVEDLLKNAPADVEVLLYNRPWNRDVFVSPRARNYPTLHRVRSWESILHLVGLRTGIDTSYTGR